MADKLSESLPSEEVFKIMEEAIDTMMETDNKYSLVDLLKRNPGFGHGYIQMACEAIEQASVRIEIVALCMSRALSMEINGEN